MPTQPLILCLTAANSLISSKIIARRNYSRVQSPLKVAYASNPNRIQQPLHSFRLLPTRINPSKLRMPSQSPGLLLTKQRWKHLASCLGRETNITRRTAESLRSRFITLLANQASRFATASCPSSNSIIRRKSIEYGQLVDETKLLAYLDDPLPCSQRYSKHL